MIHENTGISHCGAARIETERLVLRTFHQSDGEAMYRNWASDPEVVRFLTWPVHDSITVSATLAALWEQEAALPDHYQWAIELKAIGEPIGSISVVDYNESTRSVEIGYCIGRAWWGHGIVPEALTAVCSYLFKEAGVHRICAKHDVNNPNSGRVMIKSGMRFEGVQRAAARNNQGLVDVACYAVLEDEWAQKTCD